MVFANTGIAYIMAPGREKNEEPGKWLDLAENGAFPA